MLKLGNLVFDIDDYPEELQIGGSSLVTVDKYPGGWKSVQNFGAYDDAIPLQGTFRYQGAKTKAGVADAMWRSGQPVQLIAVDLMPRWVVITACKLTYKNDFEIDYDITLERVSSDDPNAILYGYQATNATTSSTTSSSSQPSTSSAATQRKYTVVSGDTLWKIASRKDIYGDGSQYTKIVTANNIKDPNKIYTGQVLIIP